MNIIDAQKDSALILIVDDDRFMRTQLRQVLEQAGYQVAEAANGEQGLAAYTRLQPDIVLLDAIMPVMDGFTCCNFLRTLPGGDRTPVLMISALDQQDSVARALEAGVVDYLTKPILWAVLSQRVGHILAESRAMEQLRLQTERVKKRETQPNLALKTILLVEDDPKTQLLVQDAIARTFKATSVQAVEDGVEAMYYLSGQNRYADRECYPLPVLILTDLKMPWISGLKLLMWVKQQSSLKQIPVVVMSNSDDPSQVKKAMNLGASAYFYKLLSMDTLVYFVQAFLPS